MNNGRLVWLDNVRAISCVLVVLLHTCAPYLYLYGKIPNTSWHIANALDSFSRICVPLFFMVSGYLFFGERSPTLKNITRILAAIAFYSSIAIIYRATMGLPIEKQLKYVATKPAFYHLWFLYALVGIYLIAMLVRVRETQLTTALAIGFALFFLLNPQASYFFDQINITNRGTLALDGSDIYYLLYAIYGALLGRMRINGDDRETWFALGILVACSAATTILTLLHTQSSGEFDSRFYEYDFPFIFGAAVSAFALIQTAGSLAWTPMQRTLSLIARLSLPIYGIHALVLDGARQLGLRDFDNALIDIPLSFIATLLLSAAMGWLIQKLDRKRIVS